MSRDKLFSHAGGELCVSKDSVVNLAEDFVGGK